MAVGFHGSLPGLSVQSSSILSGTEQLRPTGGWPAGPGPGPELGPVYLEHNWCTSGQWKGSESTGLLGRREGEEEGEHTA